MHRFYNTQRKSHFIWFSYVLFTLTAELTLITLTCKFKFIYFTEKIQKTESHTYKYDINKHKHTSVSQLTYLLPAVNDIIVYYIYPLIYCI